MTCPDQGEKTEPKNQDFFTVSSELEKLGVRVTRAEFSRLIGVSRQSVTDWVKNGRIVVGADGRFNPREAVTSYLRTGDITKIRSFVLAPMVKEIKELRERNAKLSSDLANAKDAAEFQEGSSLELLHIIELLPFHLGLSWQKLQGQPVERVIVAVNEWIAEAIKHGASDGLTICDLLPDA